MGRPFAPELRERVMAAVAEKVPYRKIAADLRVSRQTVQNWVNRARAQAAAGAPLSQTCVGNLVSGDVRWSHNTAKTQKAKGKTTKIECRTVNSDRSAASPVLGGES